jgi:aerobic carbon-monoxide dehydrogenase small subunit
MYGYSPCAGAQPAVTAAIDVMLHVNGVIHRVSVEPRQTLADALRDNCGLTGTHLGCEHGVCGACTVIADGHAIRSCLMFAVQAEGMDILTVEGLGNPGNLHPLQRAFIEHHALQCGYCTPGFLMLAAATLQETPDIDDATLRDVLASNLCRCTGYKNILTAVKAAAAHMKARAGQ